MSTSEDGNTYCDYILCHLVIAPADKSQVNFLKANYHGPCFLAELRKKKEARDNPRSSFVTAFLLALLFVISFGADAEDLKGCYFTYYPQNGEIRFEPFMKVGDKEYDSEDRQPEIWGYKPWSDSARTDDGLSLRVNVPASRFLPLGASGPIPTGSRKRTVRCPPGYW